MKTTTGKVTVVWWDATFDLTDPDITPVLVYTTGWVVRETPYYLTIAGEWISSPDIHRAFTSIPRSCIFDIETAQ